MPGTTPQLPKEFGQPPEKHRPDRTYDVRRGFAQWVRSIGRILGLRPTVD